MNGYIAMLKKKTGSELYCSFPQLFFLLVRPAGFEPATYGFVVRRSVQAELRALTNFVEMSLSIKL